MIFHSQAFLIFFAVVFPVHLLLRKTRFMNAWLLAASYFFYSWWNPIYLLLIVATTLVDFYAVQRIEDGSRRKFWLIVSLTSNLGVLGFFKYAGFLTRNLNVLLSLANLPAIPVHPHELPLGISFFTFQSISYAVDVYRRQIPAERNLIVYATYVSFFPQMSAGPICRANWLIPQLRSTPTVRTEDLTFGASLILTGMFKKVALADFLAMYVDRVYQAPYKFQAPALILATFAFAWQIYFDFSGYTDMARGIARAMGFNLTQNFRAPYVSRDLGEFWGRWNITVSNWFRDYVYIPLGGNREGGGRTIRNILITMILSGFWHGASWTFILWGAIHAVGRVATRELGPLNALIRRLPGWAHGIGVFCFVTFAWILFRAASLGDAGMIVLRMFTSGWADPRFPLLMLIPVLLIWLWQIVDERDLQARRIAAFSPARIAVAVFMIGYLIFVSQPETQKFIYFNF